MNYAVQVDLSSSVRRRFVGYFGTISARALCGETLSPVIAIQWDLDMIEGIHKQPAMHVHCRGRCPADEFPLIQISRCFCVMPKY